MHFKVNLHSASCQVHKVPEVTMALNSIGERLRFIRLLWGMSQSDIQRAGGPSRNTVSRYENGHIFDSEEVEETYERLAKALKCHLSWLKTGDGPVWIDGIIPPPGGDDSVLLSPMPKTTTRRDPELGRYILDGPTIDCAVISHAVNIVQEYVGYCTEYFDEDFNLTEGYWLIIKHLLKKDDPLGTIPHEVLKNILSVV